MNDLTITSILKKEEDEIKFIELAKKFMDLTGLGKDLTENEKEMFIMYAKSQQLNPFKKEIHAIVYCKNDPARRTVNFVTGYEVYLRRVPTHALNGWECSTKYDNGKLIGAEITIHVKGWDFPFKHRTLFREYNTGKNLWVNKPETMIKKVNTSQGFRLCFPKVFEGLPYIEEEIQGQEIMEEKKENINDCFQTFTHYLETIKIIKDILADEDKIRDKENKIKYKQGRINKNQLESEIDYFKNSYIQFFEENK